MKTILFIICCLWLSAYSRKESDYDCQGKKFTFHFFVMNSTPTAFSRAKSNKCLSHSLAGYMDGDVNMDSISYVENLVVAEPFEMVTVFFKENNIPCHKHRSWYGGFQRIRSFAAEPIASIESDNETCINYLNLTWDVIMDKALLSPNSDVIFTQIDSNYSSVRPICVQNKTAHYIKLQLGIIIMSNFCAQIFQVPSKHCFHRYNV